MVFGMMQQTKLHFQHVFDGGILISIIHQIQHQFILIHYNKQNAQLNGQTKQIQQMVKQMLHQHMKF